MKKNIFLFLLLLLFAIGSHNKAIAQDSSHLRISLLTCTPGEELYSIFGHSAIRIMDSSSVTDYVFNYGTFNFNDEGFYLKFIRGKLLYYVSVERFDDFVYSYQSDGREITEQLLNFSPEEKIAIQQWLIENLKEENKYYKYDFFLDNCTTRLRDILLKHKIPQAQLPAVMPANTTFRQAIHAYLDKGEKHWSKLGIDLLLGAPTDGIMTASEQEFLPDNLMHALDSSKNIQLVSSSKKLYSLPNEGNQHGWFTPMVCFTILLCFILLISISKSNIAIITLQNFDRLLFFMTGLMGVILILMWVCTDHSMTKNNYNLIWALPTHMVFAFFTRSKNKIVKIYFLTTAILMSIVICGWFFIPQALNTALIPFVILLLYRAGVKSIKLSSRLG